jgi:transcriptional regulator with XRE-family HTH domain
VPQFIKITDASICSGMYFFDALPSHPKPESLESLTSYLMRLAKSNGISSMNGLSAVCFPHQDRRITREIADYPPTSFESLMKVTTCSKESLLATTFFHVAAKFGRSTHPQALSRFLSGAVCDFLRYCPVCLVEQQTPHYLLSWRFLMLSYCTKHRCRLLEICGQCSRPIPLFIAPFKMGYCPFCGWNMKKSQVISEPEEKMLTTTVCTQDIEFLLKDYPSELHGNHTIHLIGQRLAYERRKRHITAVHLAQQIGITLSVVEGIERGHPMGKGASFQGYVEYANYLQLSLKEVFHLALDEFETIASNSLPLPECPFCQQTIHVAKDGHHRNGSQRYRCRFCSRGFTVHTTVYQGIDDQRLLFESIE